VFYGVRQPSVRRRFTPFMSFTLFALLHRFYSFSARYKTIYGLRLLGDAVTDTAETVTALFYTFYLDKELSTFTKSGKKRCFHVFTCFTCFTVSLPYYRTRVHPPYTPVHPSVYPCTYPFTPFAWHRGCLLFLSKACGLLLLSEAVH